MEVPFLLRITGDHSMTKSFNAFAACIHKLARKHDLSKIFNDLLTMSICSYHQTNIQTQLREKDDENEKIYHETIKPYTKDELNEFAKALAQIKLNVLSDPYSDIIGEFYMLEISSGHNVGFPII